MYRKNALCFINTLLTGWQYKGMETEVYTSEVPMN